MSGKTAPQQSPHSTAPGEASNPSAMTSLVLGILAFVIQLVVGGIWLQRGAGNDARQEVIAVALYMAVGLSAVVLGVKGRRRAKAKAPDRIAATIGLVLGIVSLVIPIFVFLAAVAWVSCCAENI